MDQHKKNRDAAADFAGLLYQKGYRGNHTISGYGGRTKRSGHLSVLLSEFLAYQQTSHRPMQPCTLETRYFDVSCRFEVHYDQVSGFQVRRMDLSWDKTKEKLSYRFSHNHQVPGAATLHGLFRHPRPWDRYLRGRGFH